jgi:hypothetical protein
LAAASATASISAVAFSMTSSGRAARPARATSRTDVHAVMTIASAPGNMRVASSMA